MKDKFFKLAPVTDIELLDKFLFYLEYLRKALPTSRLVDHCSGAMASVFELFFYLKTNNLEDYGNNEK